MPFENIHPALGRALAEQGYAEPTSVQAAVLEAPTEADLLVSAQTGSGKTVAFGLAIAPTLLGEGERFTSFGNPLALVIAPTRELAMQVERELTWLYAASNARVVTCVGGMDPRKEQRQLAGGCTIVVGTPGRLRDHLERGNLITSDLRVVVLDECDEMLDLGFREELEAILDETPTERRTLLFSATIAREIAAMAKRYQRDAVRIDTLVRNEPHGDIEYRAVRVAPSDVEKAVVNLLRYYEAGGALVFCSTREAVRRFQAALQERGFDVVALSGELSQTERTHALQALRDRRARVCVATDVAARGLDLPDLGLVIHAELPINKQTMLHRSGRTGRAGKKGVSALVVPHNRWRKAQMLIDGAGVDAAWGPAPTAESIRARDTERMLADPLLTEEIGEEDRALAATLLEGRTAEEIAAALVRLYRQRLPSAEELVEDLSAPPPRDTRPMREGEPDKRHLGDSDVAWFTMNVGRRKNADPKWLVPLICRLGHVTKREIGLIRILDNETRFGIEQAVAERFTQAVKAAGDDDIRIVPGEAPGPMSSRGPRERPPHREGDGEGFRPKLDTTGNVAPRRDKPFKKAEGKPYESKPYQGDNPRPDRPRADKPYEGKPYEGNKPRGDKPFERKPYEGTKPRSDKPFERKPYEGKPYEGAKPRSDKPFRPALDADGAAPPRSDKPAFKKPYAGKPKADFGAPKPGWAAKKPPGAPKKKHRKGNDS